jgi:hypothetical protein
VNKFFIIAALATLALTGVANADALGSLVQLRTAEWGETCTRHGKDYAICTVGKSIGKVLGMPTPASSDQLSAVYILVPGNLDQLRSVNEAKEFCSGIKRADLGTLTVSNFFKREGQVILNCGFRK